MEKKIKDYLKRIPEELFLFLLISVSILPFLGFRVLRMAGDEKVYISQAIEMARQGNWFVQTLADVPDYYKGPLHYLLVRVGLMVFGNSLWAVNYMNYLFVLLAGFSFYFLGKKLWNKSYGLILGLASALNLGVVAHVFASQMEVELCGLYSAATAFLGFSYLKGTEAKKKSKKNRNSFLNDLLNDLGFWICAGLSGWVKSPLHAVLIGLGGILFWILTGQLKTKIRSLGNWCALALGVFVSAVGYMPAYFLDYENFNRIFLGRENFQKPDNGRQVDYVLRSLPHFMFPWSFAVLGTFWASFRFFKNLILKRTTFEKLKQWIYPHVEKLDAYTLANILGLAMSLPTIFFFCWFPYKGQNYNLPAISALLLLGFAHYRSFPLWSYRLASLGGLILAVGLLVVAQHFFPGFAFPSWWGLSWFLGAVFFALLFFIIFFWAKELQVLALGVMFFFLSFGMLISPLGEWEMNGIRAFQKNHPQLKLHYYNLEPTIWSEWGLLQTVLKTEIYGLHQEDALPTVLISGNALIVPGNESLQFLKRHMENKKMKIDDFQIDTWQRWLTKGKDPATGKSLFNSAWAHRDLSLLQRDFYILWKAH